MKRWSVITSFLLFITLCVSVAYWAMQMLNPPQRAVAAPPQRAQTGPDLNAAAGLLGGHSNAVVASNFQLKGVVVASKPAQAIRVNSEVLPGVTVKEVNKHYVLLSEHGVIKRVTLPEKTQSK
jgi:general secretion pathway protein C